MDTATLSLTHRWQELQSAQDRISTHIEQELEANHGISAREYTLLSILNTQHDGTGGHFQMKQLAEQVGLSQSATTRLVSRLEGRKLLTRYICDTDRRGIYTNVTQDGAALLNQAQPTVEKTLQTITQRYQHDPQFTLYLKALTS